MKGLASSLASRFLARYTNATVPQEILLWLFIIVFAVIIIFVCYKTFQHYSNRTKEKVALHNSIDEYSNTLLYHPEDSWTYFKKGLTHQRMQEHRKAIDCFRQAIQNQKSGDGLDEIHYHLGLSYAALHEKDLAFEEYKKIDSQNKAGDLLNILMAAKT